MMTFDTPTDHLYRSSRTETTRGASLLRTSTHVTVKLEVPGMSPSDASVGVQSDEFGRKLVVHEELKELTGHSSKEVSVRLPDYVGAPSAPARFTNGIVEVTFERVTPKKVDDVSIEVE